MFLFPQTQIKGVKGASILSLHQPFDLALGCTVDNLHTLYLGVTLLLMKMWFSKEFKNKDYSLYKQACDMSVINTIIYVTGLCFRYLLVTQSF